MFPSNDACLDFLFQKLYGERPKCPGCNAQQKYHRVRRRKCYSCQKCAHQIYPTKGTIFEGSQTDLLDWFEVILEFHLSKQGVTAKYIQRQTGVTYKTAWRMGHKIRELMNEDAEFLLSGIVEVDETFWGGKTRKIGLTLDEKHKLCFFGMIERGGNCLIYYTEKWDAKTLLPIILSRVKEKSKIYGDDDAAVKKVVNHGYVHGAVNHKARQWRKGEVYSNTIENLWSRFKALTYTHRYISRRWAQNYANEVAFRHNRKKEDRNIFLDILGRIDSTSPAYVFQQSQDFL